VAAASYRFAWRPRWVAGHAVLLAAVVGMVWLGRWQLTVSERKHFSLQNFGYALQWWAFSIFAVGFWIKIVHDAALGRRSAESQPVQAPIIAQEPVAYRRYVKPTLPTEDADPEVDRYNAYLAALAEQDKK
jgi:DNA-binding transcriptional regulator of glucitol operon